MAENMEIDKNNVANEETEQKEEKEEIKETEQKKEDDEGNKEKSKIFNKTWEITLYKGNSSKYKHEVFVIKIKSLSLEVEKAFYLSDFVLNFNKTVKPFMALVGIVKSSYFEELQCIVNDMIAKGNVIDQNDSVESLFGNSAKINIKEYCQNISKFVKQNGDLFAVKSDNNSNENSTDDTFNSKNHYGAYLNNAYYKEKFSKSTDESLLAICTSKFKTIADIDEDKYFIKDVVNKFVEQKCILKGNGSSTIEKDLTLSRGNEVRCYVLDMDAIKSTTKTSEASNNADKTGKDTEEVSS